MNTFEVMIKSGYLIEFMNTNIEISIYLTIT